MIDGDQRTEGVCGVSRTTCIVAATATAITTDTATTTLLVEKANIGEREDN